MGLGVLHFAKSIFIPLIMAIMFSYALKPIVNRMVRFGLPHSLAAAALLVALIGGSGFAAYAVSDDGMELLDMLPKVAQDLRKTLAESRRSGKSGPANAIEKVQKAAAEFEKTAEETSEPVEPDQKVTKVQIEDPKFNVKDYIWPGTLGLVSVAANVVIVVFITFFLLASGNHFRRKMVKLAGPTLSKKKITVHALDEIDSQIQRYLLVQVLTSSLVGLATWLSFWWIGMEHAVVWGMMAFVFNFIPYVGSVVVSIAAMLIGFSQFGSFEMMVLIASIMLVINVAEGYILTPLLTSHASRMNPVAVFVGVLAWGWLWGVWGLFLGVPILVVIKTVCDRVEGLKAVGEILGR
jgi:predicted PurR-regulated permease PerM